MLENTIYICIYYLSFTYWDFFFFLLCCNENAPNTGETNHFFSKIKTFEKKKTLKLLQRSLHEMKQTEFSLLSGLQCSKIQEICIKTLLEDRKTEAVTCSKQVVLFTYCALFPLIIAGGITKNMISSWELQRKIPQNPIFGMNKIRLTSCRQSNRPTKVE